MKPNSEQAHLANGEDEEIASERKRERESQDQDDSSTAAVRGEEGGNIQHNMPSGRRGRERERMKEPLAGFADGKCRLFLGIVYPCSLKKKKKNAFARIEMEYTHCT